MAMLECFLFNVFSSCDFYYKNMNYVLRKYGVSHAYFRQCCTKQANICLYIRRIVSKTTIEFSWSINSIFTLIISKTIHNNYYVLLLDNFYLQNVSAVKFDVQTNYIICTCKYLETYPIDISRFN